MSRKLSPEWERNKVWIAKRVAELRAYLGGKCVDCGTDEQLEFDHIKPRTWVARKVSSGHRICIYWREAMEGMIALRCGACNKAKRRREDEQDIEEQFPTEDNPF
jgi:5-methylcytosine-specific restriction endonuclease McrA